MPFLPLVELLYSSWAPPPSGFFKLNFDGSVIGNSCHYGIGGIIRDYSAMCILSFFGPSGLCSANEAELLALRMGLGQADRLGLSNIIAESDSFCAICWVLVPNRPGGWQTLLRRFQT